MVAEELLLESVPLPEFDNFIPSPSADPLTVELPEVEILLLPVVFKPRSPLASPVLTVVSPF